MYHCLYKLRRCQLKKASKMKRGIRRIFMWDCRITINQMSYFYPFGNTAMTSALINSTIKFNREVQKTTYVCTLHTCYKHFSKYHIKHFLDFPDTKFFEMFCTENSMDPIPIFDCLKERRDIEEILIIKTHPVVILYRRILL